MKKLLFFVLLASVANIPAAIADEKSEKIKELIVKLKQDSDILNMDEQQINMIQNPKDRLPFIERMKKDQAIFDAHKADFDKLQKPKK